MYTEASFSTWDDKQVWKMALRPGAPGDYDLVSSEIRTTGQVGNAQKLAAGVMEALKRCSSTPTASGEAQNCVLFDIGAGIGWYTLLAAYSGYEVVSIEPFEENIQLLNASLCVAPSAVKSRVSLFNIGLGAPPADGATCELWQQPKGNRGNTYTICGTGDFSFQEMNALRSVGYKALGSARIRALDEIVLRGTLRQNMAGGKRMVLKLDMGGWEPMALSGTKEVVEKYSPDYIFAKFSPVDIRRAALTTGSTSREARWKAAEFLSFMQAQGYKYTLESRNYNSSQDIVFTRNAPSQTAAQQAATVGKVGVA